jgi:hypothetical protein
MTQWWPVLVSAGGGQVMWTSGDQCCASGGGVVICCTLRFSALSFRVKLLIPIYIRRLSPRPQIVSHPSLMSQSRQELPEWWIQMVNGLLLYLQHSFYLGRVMCKILQNESYFISIEPTMNHWLACLQLMTLFSNQFRDRLITSTVVCRIRSSTRKVWELLSVTCFIASEDVTFPLCV